MPKTPEQLTNGALHVSFAMQMACTLPPHTDDASLPGEVQVACLESYMSNMRVLIDFLTRKQDRRDIHRRDYLTGWDPTQRNTIDRLEELWEPVSQTVSHLSWERIPYPGRPFVLQNVAPANLHLLASLMLDLADEFTAELEAKGQPNRVQFRAAVDLCQARPEY